MRLQGAAQYGRAGNLSHFSMIFLIFPINSAHFSYSSQYVIFGNFSQFPISPHFPPFHPFPPISPFPPSKPLRPAGFFSCG